MMSFMQNSRNNRGSNHASTSGTLPSNTIPNPRNECKGITTRSGVVLDGRLPHMPPPYVNPDNEKAKETEVTKDKVQPCKFTKYRKSPTSSSSNQRKELKRTRIVKEMIS
ncbi:hypothetical protein Tco_0176067 [Tanacetum coccineum]